MEFRGLTYSSWWECLSCRAKNRMRGRNVFSNVATMVATLDEHDHSQHCPDLVWEHASHCCYYPGDMSGCGFCSALLYFVFERDPSFPLQNTLVVCAAATPVQHTLRCVRCSCNRNTAVLLAEVLKRGFCASRSCAYPLHGVCACMSFHEPTPRPFRVSLH